MTEAMIFPAVRAVRQRASAATAVAEDAACFFHADNRAEQVCDGCGRYLCSVCSVDFGGARLCPSCIATKRTAKREMASGVVLHDNIALHLSLLPLILWPFTAITAPTALGYVIYAWRKPLSVTRRSRARLWVAGIAAVVQICGWGGLLIMALAD